VVRARDPFDVVVGHHAVGAVDQRAHLPGVDEQRFAAPVALRPFL
jgi:hypothetical protein